MRFTTSLAVVAAAVVPAALAQSVNIDAATLTQCATTTVTFEGSSGPYYVAVVPANDPCSEDAIAEFYDVTGTSVDYYVNQPSGTSVQMYVLDVNGVETWGQIETVGNGDASCLPGYVAPSNPSTNPSTDPSTNPPTDPSVASNDNTPSDPSTDSTSSTDAAPSTSIPASTSTPVSLYVPPSPSTTAAALTYSNTGSGSTSSGNNDSGSSSDTTTNDNAPANAASNDTSGASSLTASVTLLVGAFAAVVALF